jgi:hypothetical protein
LRGWRTAELNNVGVEREDRGEMMSSMHKQFSVELVYFQE